MTWWPNHAQLSHGFLADQWPSTADTVGNPAMMAIRWNIWHLAACLINPPPPKRIGTQHANIRQHQVQYESPVWSVKLVIGSGLKTKWRKDFVKTRLLKRRRDKTAYMRESVPKKREKRCLKRKKRWAQKNSCVSKNKEAKIQEKHFLKGLYWEEKIEFALKKKIQVKSKGINHISRRRGNCRQLLHSL